MILRFTKKVSSIFNVKYVESDRHGVSVFTDCI